MQSFPNYKINYEPTQYQTSEEIPMNSSDMLDAFRNAQNVVPKIKLIRSSFEGFASPCNKKIKRCKPLNSLKKFFYWCYSFLCKVAVKCGVHLGEIGGINIWRVAFVCIPRIAFKEKSFLELELGHVRDNLVI